MLKDGIEAGVLHVPTLKPLDEQAILQAAKETGAVVTMENHTIKWVHLSSKNGDLPRPGESTQQTGSLVADLDGDGDLDILNKPYNWEVPRVDVWLNNGTGTRRANRITYHSFTNRRTS